MKAIVALALCVAFGTPVLTSAQMHRLERTGRRAPNASHSSPAPCFDSADAADIRLWPDRAPGATGDDPCRDIPFLRAYPSAPGTNPTGQAIIIVPGGGYDRLTDAKEQEPVAEYVSQQLNVTAFILYYRLVQSDGTYRYPVPMWDGQRAVRLVRGRAASFGINPARIGLFGFSAGGHLAATITLHHDYDFGLKERDSVDRIDARPNLLGLGYPVISMDPAQFAARSSHDHLLYGYSAANLTSCRASSLGRTTCPPMSRPSSFSRAWMISASARKTA